MRLIRLSCTISFLVSLPSHANAQTAPGPGYVELTALRAHRSGMPAALGRRVTLRHTGIPLELALVEVARQAGLGLAYGKDLTIAERLSAKVIDNLPAADAFEQLLEGTPWTVYISRSGQAIVAERPFGSADSVPDGGAISGRITDRTTGRPIPYATVRLEGTDRGATANESGVYRIATLGTGTYTVVARTLGYIAVRKSVAITAGAASVVDFALLPSSNQLDQVVVTGTIVPTAVKALPTPISIITSDDIDQQHPHDIQELFRQVVPSAVAWDEAAYPATTNFSVRGTTTLNGGVGQMKVYVDGVEVANATNAGLDPNSIDRIEVIRGPEAAAIYGSDAIGGVIQIFTKRGDPAHPRPEVSAEAAVADVQTPYPGSRNVPRQSYSASIRGGDPQLSFSLGGSYKFTNNYIPNGETSKQSADGVYGGTHYDKGIIAFDLSGRYYEENNPNVANPTLFSSGFSYLSAPFYTPTTVTHETVGAHFAVTPTNWWTNTATVGVDVLQVRQVQTRARNTYPGDVLLSVFEQNNSRTSIAYNSTIHGTLMSGLAGSITVGADHYSFPSSFYFAADSANQGLLNGAIASRTMTQNSGAFVQGQLGIADALFLTAGLRAEWNTDFGDSLGIPVSPRVGASYVAQIADVTIKVRASYGSAIRPPNPGDKEASVSPGAIVLPNPTLGPERQHGGDGGIDVTIGHRVSVGVTYFDQTAINLIQQVQLPSDTIQTFKNENVGRVTNTGVELEGGLFLGGLRLKGQYAYTRSRVDALASGYTGDSRVGDQVMLVPRNTAGVSMTLPLFRATTISGGLTYLGSWTNYDNIAYYRCIGGTGPCRNTSGNEDRSYFKSYPSLTKVNATVSQGVGRYTTVFVSVDNLTNNTRYELTDYLPVMGRITSVGFRLHY